MNKSSLIVKVLLSIALLVFVYFSFLKSPKSKSGELAPDFETQLVDGSSFKLSDLHGSYVLLDFWGSWCPPCRRDNPNLVKINKLFKDKKFKDADSFEMVTIALEKNASRNKAAAEKDGFNWKHQIVQESRYVLTAPLALKYNISNVPTKFLIDPEGKVLGVNLGTQEIIDLLNSKMK